MNINSTLMGAALAAAGLALTFVETANAAVYNFDVIYSGNGAAVLAPGSDDMLGVAPVNGDTVNYSITGSGSDYWTTLQAGGPFIDGAIGDLLVSNNAAVGGFNYAFSFNQGGIQQFAGSGSGDQCCADLGPRQIDFPNAMKFNNFSESITLTSIAGPLQFGSLLPAWPGQSPEGGAPNYFSYSGSVSAVPEPATWATMLAGFAVLGFVGYRRNRIASVAA